MCSEEDKIEIVGEVKRMYEVIKGRSRSRLGGNIINDNYISSKRKANK